jgi:hypothetical protein
MDKAEITTLQQQPVVQITDKLATMERADLVELLAQETASATPRSTLVAAIEKQLVVLGDGETDSADKNSPAVGNKGAPAVKAADKPAPITRDDWRHPEYSGPLHGEQAAWRVRNIKPAAKVSTK